MGCFLPSSLSTSPSRPSLCPDFSLDFPALERDYIGLGHNTLHKILDKKISAALGTTTPLFHKPPLPDHSSHHDLCGSHLKLAPPSSGADHAGNDGGDADDGEPSSANVGWPPISSYRKSTTKALSIKPPCSIETTTPLIVHEAPLEEATIINNYNIKLMDDKQEASATIMHMDVNMNMKPSLRKPLHIKVSMDGTPIMRKLDLESMQGYQHLSLELHKLFKFYKKHLACEVGVHSCFKDLNGASFILTYKDRDGDWMLVGDTPWESFAQSARRIRIMRKAK